MTPQGHEPVLGAGLSIISTLYPPVVSLHGCWHGAGWGLQYDRSHSWVHAATDRCSRCVHDMCDDVCMTRICV